MGRILIASIVGSIVYLLFGWLIFEGLLGEYTNSHTTNIPGFKKSSEESSMFFLILSCFAYATLLAFILGIWTNTYSFLGGFKVGAIVGTLVALMANSFWYSTSNFYNSLAPMIVDICAATITVGSMGGIISLALGYNRSKNQTN